MPAPFDSPNANTLALDSVVSRLEAAELRIREAEAERVALLAEAFNIAAAESDRAESRTPIGVGAELAYRAVRAEVATALRLSERTAEKHMEHARTLTAHFPRVFEAFRAGEVSYRHTGVICEAGAVLGSADTSPAVLRRARYEEAVLPIARDETPNRLQPLARRFAERFSETALDERHAEARKLRRVFVVDQDDGMADLVAHLPAVEAHAIHRRLTGMGRGVGVAQMAASSVAAPLDEVRADLLAALVLSGSPSGEAASPAAVSDLASIRASVQVVVPVERILPAGAEDILGDRASEAGAFGVVSAGGDRSAGADGSADTDGSAARTAATVGAAVSTEDRGCPPHLEGYGPIDTQSARILAGGASHWERVFADTSSGEVLSVERYRPSEQMRRLLRARDMRCRFPGCRQLLARCDIDHTVDAALGGATSVENLAHLCRGHHVLKHRTGWRAKQRAGGVMEWTTPTGRTRVDAPPGCVLFRPVPGGEPPPPWE